MSVERLLFARDHTGARDTAKSKAESCPSGKAHEVCLEKTLPSKQKHPEKPSDTVKHFRREQNRAVMNEKSRPKRVGRTAFLES